MSHFLTLDGERIVGVVEADTIPGDGWIQFDGWPGWGARPSPRHAAFLIDSVLVWQDPRTLEQAKADRIADMRVARDAAIEGGFTWNSLPFDSDSTAQLRLVGLAVAAMADPLMEDKPWRLADNTWTTVNSSQALQVYTALGGHIEAMFAQFAAREAAINAATTIEEVEAITWEGT
ncbi:MAG TPA: hypothetical protein DCY18_12645 [Thauera sp.]|nr:hypothetical protein [Acidimicrobiaceae bacterium]HAY10763.1 hypothetical protein [Thauera sp.]HRI97191.1 DUF4376 domain-containing protein [Nocardioides sp.]